MNRLSSERSPYLRSASHQPVDWFAWGDEPFEKATREQKPILLDIGAVWCHWCHVMDSESYEDPPIAHLINQRFVAIKVDRDERPDLDARYQAAVGSITGQGGWPLTGFLLPDGRAFYGGTYFPPEDRYGRPGFPAVLNAIADAFDSDRENVVKNAEQIERVLKSSFEGTRPPAEIDDRFLQQAIANIRSAVDSINGGFGGAPKFPHPGAIELLLSCYDRTRNQWMIDAIKTTLTRMAAGGVYDQLGGGFHRYSTDGQWIVPHFEKMLYDNAPLLSNYLHTFQATEDVFFGNIARSIIAFVMRVLYDESSGGFFASQDADAAPGDDGSYFTWTAEEVRNCVSKEEFDVLQLHFNIYEDGEMPPDKKRNVLFVDKSTSEISALLKTTIDAVERILASARKRLLVERAKRPAPFVDPTIYSSWNGMMISALLEASAVFDDPELERIALRSLESILTEHKHSNGLVTHRQASLAQDMFLDDQVHIAAASLEAFRVTSSPEYLLQADSIMSGTISLFWDEAGSGFRDVPLAQTLPLIHRPIQDSPTPGGNATAALVLLDLAALTGKATYQLIAEQIIRTFSGTVKDQGIFAATYFRALQYLLYPPLHVVILESDALTAKHLHRTAIKCYRPGTLVSLSTASGLPSFIQRGEETGSPTAFVCSGTACAPPVHDANMLESTIRLFGRTSP